MVHLKRARATGQQPGLNTGSTCGIPEEHPGGDF